MLSVSNVAKRVRRDPETVRRWIRVGRLKAHKIGTQHFVEEEDLDVLLGYEAAPLSDELQRMYDGSPMPNWEQMIRNDRNSH